MTKMKQFYSSKIKIRKGAREGCILFPRLFYLSIQLNIMRLIFGDWGKGGSLAESTMFIAENEELTLISKYFVGTQ